MVQAIKDQRWMRYAILLSKRHEGMTAENPSVGCVIVKQNQVLAAAVTAKTGRPHAEVVALEQAGKQARGATVYVTLEPCSHQGQTGPCTEALIQAGVARVVVAAVDPSEKISGKGITALTQAGIEVQHGVLEEEAKEAMRGFFSVHERGRPAITVKIATSLDGKIALHNGKSRWITGRPAREYVHLLRARHDAIMVGSGTVMHDDPMLNCRLSGLESASPLRIIVGKQLSTFESFQLIKTADEIPVSFLTTNAQEGSDGVQVIQTEATPQGEVDFTKAFSLLAQQGINAILVEGGSRLVTRLLTLRLIDQLIWIRAPMVIGDDGIAAFGDLGLDEVIAEYEFSPSERFNCGDDEVVVLTTPRGRN